MDSYYSNLYNKTYEIFDKVLNIPMYENTLKLVKESIELSFKAHSLNEDNKVTDEYSIIFLGPGKGGLVKDLYTYLSDKVVKPDENLKFFGVEPNAVYCEHLKALNIKPLTIINEFGQNLDYLETSKENNKNKDGVIFPKVDLVICDQAIYFFSDDQLVKLYKQFNEIKKSSEYSRIIFNFLETARTVESFEVYGGKPAYFTVIMQELVGKFLVHYKIGFPEALNYLMPVPTLSRFGEILDKGEVKYQTKKTTCGGVMEDESEGIACYMYGMDNQVLDLVKIKKDKNIEDKDMYDYINKLLAEEAAKLKGKYPLKLELECQYIIG